MPDYKQGKIYKITAGDLVYIGSTTEPTLAHRLAGHVRSFKHWKSGKGKTITSFKLIESGNYEITLIELFPCNSKDELTARERFYIQSLSCVNKCIPGRNSKQCYEDHKDRIKQYHQDNKDIRHQHYEDNKVVISERHKQYREQNKDAISEKKKQFYEDNRDAILEQKKQYAVANKDEISEKQKIYRELNKDKISEQRKLKYELKKKSILSNKAE